MVFPNFPFSIKGKKNKTPKPKVVRDQRHQVNSKKPAKV